MKKFYYAASLLALASLSVLTSCKKDTVAFPTNPQSNGNTPDLAYTTPWFPIIHDADGIFVSAQVIDEKTVIVSSYFNTYEYGMAKITNATGNFSGLTDAGAITLNDSVMVKSTALSYLSSIANYTLNLSNTATWKIAGNGTIVPAITRILPGTNNPTYSYDVTTWDVKWAPVHPRHLYALPPRPAITHLTTHSSHLDSLFYIAHKDSILTYLTDSTTRVVDSTFNVTTQFIIPIKNYTTNADSVFIYMTDINGLVYKRTALPTDVEATFTPNDFANTSSYDLASFKLQVNAIKYSHLDTVFGGVSKRYYFLKMASSIKYYQATR
jgi:hypothetical protein